MKILIIKTGALGDMIGASAFFQTVKENFPEDSIYLLTQEIYRDVVDASPVFTKIFFLPRGYKFFQLLRIFTKLRRLRIDMVLDIQGNIKTNFYCSLTGGKKRYGSYRRRAGRLFLTKGIKRRTKKQQAKHPSAKPSPSILKFLGIEGHTTRPKLWIPEEKRRSFPNFVKDQNLNESREWVLMHPLTTKGYLARRWLNERCAELADKLINDGYEVLFIGAGESEYVESIISRMKNTPKNLTDKTDFHNLCLVIEKASLVITMDSSPLHISVVAGTQAIGIFGSTDPLIICPKGAEYIYKAVGCNPCYKKICADMKCMKAIMVDEVYNKAKEMLAQNESEYSLFNR
ncbi:MAG: glycosyltransferase family 9 protein [Elusimicrobia bacterium]|nr:glycosyltransferase family 9 protein [Elusimicrobiota bacterium]